MHLAAHTWMRPEPLEKTLDRLSRLGYSGVELAGEPDQYPVGETRALLKKYNISCWGMVTIQQGKRDLIAADPQQRRDSINYVKDVVSLSASLGGQIVTVVPGSVGKIVSTSAPEDEWNWAVEGLREVAALAKEKGIKIGIEPLNRFETYFINRSDQALALADEVGYGVGIAFDPFHLALEEADLFAAIRRCKGCIIDFHVADNNRLAPGDGSFVWEDIIPALAEAGYDGALAIEAMPPVDRTPIGKFGSLQREDGTIEVSADHLKFIQDHGSALLGEEYYTDVMRRSAAKLAPYVEKTTMEMQVLFVMQNSCGEKSSLSNAKKCATTTERRHPSTPRNAIFTATPWDPPPSLLAEDKGPGIAWPGLAISVEEERPSNARIHQLEEENNQLRASLQARVSATLTMQSPPDTLPSDRDFRILESRDQPRETLSTETGHAVKEMQSLPCGQPNMSVDDTMPTRSQDQQGRYFHGPSSVMFDPDNNRRASLKHHNHQPLLNEGTRAQLVAQHTKQRHLEMINANSGELDLDGVDVDLAMDLLAIFWNRQHYEGSAIYRPVFMRDMAANGPYFSKLLLYAILFAASKYAVDDRVRSDPHDPETTGIPFRRRFEEILVEPGANRLFESKLTTAQALLIVANVLLSWRDESSLAWHYTGVAINMIIDLGIHTERHPTHSISIYKAEKVEVHRRVFWAAFILDKIHAIYQGRPARLSGTNISVPILFHDDYDEFEPFQTLTFTATPRQLRCPTHSLSTMVELCKLSQIMDKILRELYAEQSQSRTASDILNTSMILHHELKRWRGELPPHLNVRRRSLETAVILPHTLAMVSMYDSLIILLHRPFVSEGHLQSASSFIAREALSHCVTAAFEVHDMLQLYRQHFCVKTVPYFMSYATYVSATIHARLASLKSMGSLPRQCLRNCLNVLTEQQTKCLAPRRTLSILKQLIRRLGLRVEDLPTEESEVSRGNESNSDGDILTLAISSPPEGACHSRVSEQTPAGVVAEDRMHDGNMSNFDSMFLDMDMDSILKSFGVLSNDAVPVQPGGSRFDGGMVSESIRGAESTAQQQEYEQGPESSGFPVFSDPLFGFDFDIS